MAVKFYKSENQVPLEMHKVRMIQKLTLIPVEERIKKIQEAGNNTFLLQNKDVYLDMLTDSGVNAMSDNQFAASLQADDAYAGSATFLRVKKAIKDGLSEDLEKDAEGDLQKIHDKMVKKVDELLAAKSKEIMTV